MSAPRPRLLSRETREWLSALAIALAAAFAIALLYRNGIGVWS